MTTTYTLAQIIDVLEARKVPGVTMHDDDLGLRVNNDLLDDLIEEFKSLVNDENDFPIVRLPGSLTWENGRKYGQALEEAFPGQGGTSLRLAMEYNDLGPVSETNGIAGLVMTQEGERDEKDWVWRVTMQDGSVWYATGWCDYTGWDCRSGLAWKKT